MKKQAYIVECDNLGPGEQIWFSSCFEAEQGFLEECCKLVPVPADYSGPRWIPED